MAGRVVIAGAASGVGKTTIASGIAAALHKRGVGVAPFKVGPDYIDPSYLSRAAGAPARNLDGWLLPPAALVDLFSRASSRADVCVIEGVMGLFDGRGASEEGSTAEIAKLLRAPVILVVDAGKVSRTAAAVVLGLQRFDPDLQVAGVILNGIGSPRHLAWTAGPIEDATGLPVLGYLPRRDHLSLPERHLGLIPTTEGLLAEDFFERLTAQVEETIDVGRLLALAQGADPMTGSASRLFPEVAIGVRARIAVARDEAFSFYYEDSLDLLRAWGAELVEFSPIHDQALPSGVGGVYLGGGFPELFGAELAANASMLASVRKAWADGITIYGECGGLMYLSEGIVDSAGGQHRLAGIVPGWSTIEGTRLTMGYRTATAEGESFLLKKGEAARGHEFHWSRIAGEAQSETAAYLLDDPPRLEGYGKGSVLGSYLHLHLGSNPVLAPRFVEACAG
jgi:cobyrinic acid a,c-diamide synthase